MELRTDEWMDGQTDVEVESIDQKGPAVQVVASPSRVAKKDNVVCFVCKEGTGTDG